MVRIYDKPKNNTNKNVKENTKPIFNKKKSKPTNKEK